VENVPVSSWVIIVVLLVLNFLISIWNSYVVGKLWPHTRIEGGWCHWISWMGYIQAIFGFSWCFLMPLVALAYSQHWFGFGVREVVVSLELGYLVIGGSLIISGLFIWIESLMHAWREKTLGSGAVAAWNTYAQLSNMYDFFVNAKPFALDIVNYFGNAFSVGSSSDDDDGSGAIAYLAILVIALAVGSIFLGWILASAISGSVARSEARRFRSELRDQEAAKHQGV
jgi:hypothetical protein